MLNFRPYYLTLLSRISHPIVTVPLSSPILSLIHVRPRSITPFFWPTLAPSSPYCPLCHPPSHPLTPFSPHSQISHHSITSLFFLIFNYTLFPLLLHSLTSPSYPILSTYLFASKPSLSTCIPQLSPNDVLVSHPTLFTHLFLPLLSLNPLFTQFSNAYQGHSLIPLSNPTLLPLIPLSHYPLTPV